MDYESKIRTVEVDELFEAVLELGDVNECYRFFEDICTMAEIKSIAQRLAVSQDVACQNHLP